MWSSSGPRIGALAMCRSSFRHAHIDLITRVPRVARLVFRLPYPSTDFAKAIGDIGPLLVTAVPLGIYNFTEGMNNVESAAAAGDDYNLRHILFADGIGAIVGAVLGS